MKEKVTVLLDLKPKMERIRKKRGMSQGEYIDSLIRNDSTK
jgi:hypothetical protein